jgi:YVTN family beta-propeller protein
MYFVRLRVVACVLVLAFFPAFLVAQNSDTYRVYTTNELSGDLSVIDPQSGQAVATIPLGKRPRGIHASPDRQTIYVTLSGSPVAGPGVDEKSLPPADPKADGIGVFDVAQNKLVKVIASGSDPEQFDVSADGKLLFVANENSASMSVVDIAKGVVTHTLPVGEEPEGVKVSPNGKFVYVTSETDSTVAVIDLRTVRVIKVFKVGGRPRSVAFLPDGSRAYVTGETAGSVTVVDALKHEPLKEIQIGEIGVVRPMTVIVSPDSKTAYVSTGRGHKVFALDTNTNTVSGSVEVGARPWGITLSPDGKKLYSANGPSNDVTEVDLATFRVTKHFKAGTGPWGIIAIAP